MISDFIVACRGLRRSPAFTVAAVVTLALGFGANSTMFSVVNSVLLRPLPGYLTDRLVQVSDTGIRNSISADAFVAMERMKLESFEALAANQNCRVNFTGQGESEQLNGPCTTANWFEMLHAQAMLGRTFLPDEDHHGHNHVVVLDYGYWQRRFGGDRGIVDRKLIFDNEPWVVIGVMPAGFKPAGVNGPIYTPYVVEDHPHGLNVIGRLKPGVSIESAQSELDAVTARLLKDYRSMKLKATPLLERVTGEQRPLLLLLLGAVSFVLLIACVNVANLMLARSAARQQEVAIRLALGATGWRILRFALAEALVISASACVLAVLIAYWGIQALKPLTRNLPRADELAVDWHVLIGTLSLGVSSAMLFGIFPALRRERLPGAAGMTSRTTARPQRLLISAEVALALVLLSGAGLLIQTFAAIRSHDLGYDPRHVLTNFLALPESADGSRTVGVELYTRIRERVAALPGVRSLATVSRLPMFGVTISVDVHPEGEPVRMGHEAALVVASGDYFKVMAIPLLAGRTFASADREGSTRVAVVSESMARRHFEGKAIGRRLVLPRLKFNIDGGHDVSVEIVGVSGNVCVNSVEDCEAEHIYLPETQNGLRMEHLVVRTEGDPKAMAKAVRRAVYLEAPDIPLDDAETLEERTSYLSRDPGRAMWLLGVFAGLAILLAAVGIYGVSAYLAAQRSREIGIRIALGAQSTDIAGLIYRGVLIPSVFGLAAGIAGAAALTRLLKALLYGVAPGDPKTLALAAIVLLVVSMLSATSPAIRAGLTDPAEVLRRD
jgi:predicted permease